MVDKMVYKLTERYFMPKILYNLFHKEFFFFLTTPDEAAGVGAGGKHVPHFLPLWKFRPRFCVYISLCWVQLYIDAGLSTHCVHLLREE